MQFCTKCGTILAPLKVEEKVILKCSKCGFESKKADKALSKVRQDREKIIVIGKEAQKIRTLPIAKVECPKCNNEQAYYWLVQTRGADESSTQFFRCSRCNYTWREMS